MRLRKMAAERATREEGDASPASAAGEAPVSGCPKSTTENEVINVSARQSAREVNDHG